MCARALVTQWACEEQRIYHLVELVLSPIFTGVLGVKLGQTDLCSKHFYPLSSLVGPRDPTFQDMSLKNKICDSLVNYPFPRMHQGLRRRMQGL